LHVREAQGQSPGSRHDPIARHDPIESGSIDSGPIDSAATTG